MRHLAIFVVLLAFTSALTLRWNVDCGGSACPSAYRLSQTAPTVGTPANNQAVVCNLGDTIIFNISSIATNHPFHIKTAQGTGSGNAYSFASPNTPLSTAGQVTVNCDSNLCARPSGRVYYQCTFHSSMNGLITVNGCPTPTPTPVPPTGPVPAPVATPKAPAPPTICEKYATALKINQTTLMKKLVGDVITAEVANPSIKIFFDGTQPKGSTNFLANTNALNHLSGGLVSFFGAALGCSEPGFPKYTGPSDMKALHQPMGIGRTQFNTFNDIFIQVLQTNGVDAADRVTIRGVLDSFVNDLVNPTIICAKYAAALKVNQTQLMTTIVSAVVSAELKSQRIEVFFNGTAPPGSTNFEKDTVAYNRLAGGLIAFFGAALGCNEPGFPKYTGQTDMKALHAAMPIGRGEFDHFNDIFIQTLGSLGVDSGDQATVRSILDSFAPQIVNPRIICNKYATALKLSQVQLMTTIVNTVVSKELADASIKPFFDGRKPTGSTNFTSDTTAFNRLAGGLVAFFGGALGCSEAGFPKYTGVTDMKALHANMPISSVEFKSFNDNFITALAGLGVDAGDQKTIRWILDSFANQIINPSYICDKYAKALGTTQINLMTTIVSKIVANELAQPSLKVYFDGTKPPGSTDFTTNTNAYNKLAGNLIAFFGKALGCNEPGKKRFPAYTGNTDMKALHAPMNITKAEFDLFNKIFIDTLASLGVDQVDQALVLSVLNGFSGAIVGSMTPTNTGGDPDLIAKGYTFYQPLDCTIGVYWKPVDLNARTVSFAVRRPTDGFVALGFPQDGKFAMIGSDAVIGWVSTSGVSVKAYELQAKYVENVVPNTKMTITDTSADEVNGVTTIYFTRSLDDGNNPIADPSAVVLIASSLDGNDGLGYHSCRVSSATVVNLFTGSGSQGAKAVNPLKDAHGALMMSGWGIFFVLGLLVARYGRDAFKDGLWFKIHQFTQTFGLLLTTAAFIMSWFMVDGIYFNTTFHAQLGTAVMGLLYFQWLGGVFRPHLVPDQEKTLPRKAFEFFHPWVGRILCIAATVNIFAGINIWWPYWVNIIYAIIVAFFTLFALIAEVMKQSGSKGDDQYHQMT